MARKTWDVGNLFAVPLADGSFSLGQVVGREAQVLNSITCAFYRTRVSASALANVRAVPAASELIAIQFTTKDSLTRRFWKVLGAYPVELPRHLFPHEDKRAHNWIGAEMFGSGNMVNFLNAYFGLKPWNVMFEEDYYDQLLAPGVSRPRTAIVLSASDREAYRRQNA
jgi:hypothetical protein